MRLDHDDAESLQAMVSSLLLPFMWMEPKVVTDLHPKDFDPRPKKMGYEMKWENKTVNNDELVDPGKLKYEELATCGKDKPVRRWMFLLSLR
jgi:hypothetical protein